MGTQFQRSDDLNKELRRIIEEADQELVIISPYIELSTRFNNALQQVSQKDTKVTIISRYEEKTLAKKDKKLYDALVAKGFELYLVDRLHSKLYFTQRKGILASVNFHKSSQQHSEEVGIVTDEPAMMREFKRYAEDLQEKAIVRWGVDSHAAEDVLLVSKSTTSKNYSGGYCIRTGEKIPFDLKKPFSYKAFKSWNRTKNLEFKEKFCHYSGEKSGGSNSFSKPILSKHWNAAKKKHGF